MEFIIDTVNLEDIKEAVEYMPCFTIKHCLHFLYQ